MKMKAIAACVVLGTPSVTAAQDCSILVNPFGGTVTIEYNGSLPVQQLWSDISVRLSGNGPITILNQSNNYTDLLSPNGAVITGNGTGNVTFVGTAGGALLGGTHTPDNPWAPFTFSYGGDFQHFGFQLFGQNTCYFVQAPFGNPINILNGDGSPGPLSYRIWGPAPGTATLLAFSGVVAFRRRRA
jgi:hypothetical protein